MDTVIYRTCTNCESQYLATSEFFFRKKDGKYGLSSRCKSCDYKRKVRWQKENPDKHHAIQRRVYQKRKRENPNYDSEYRKRVLREVKETVFSHYGGCACCGEDTFEFLSIDHINGDGAKHRKPTKKSSMRTYNVYKDIIDSGFPSTIQVLCFNCHFSKDFYGACPHGNVARQYTRNRK